MVVGFQSLNDDVLILIIALIPRSDMQNLALTSRTVSPVARRRILYSLRLNAPVKNLEFHNFMLEEDDGQRIQYLRKLTIICSKSPWRHKSADIYSPLATVLARAQNLRALVVSELEEQLAMEGGSVLGDAIASMRRLRELELRCVATRGMALCERLACRPRVVRLEALSPFSIPNSRAQVQPATLVGLEILRNASEITLHNFQLRCDEEVPLPQPHTYRWNRARTLSLKNMDPVALAPLCQNLAYLQMAFWQANDAGRGTRYGGDYHYTRTAEFTDDVHVASQLRVLDIYIKVNWNCEKSQIYDTVTLTVRMSLPVVLSMQFHYGDTILWTELAELSEQAAARLRYLDVLMHDDHSGAAQMWLDECLPLFSDSDLLCIRLRLVDQIDRVIDLKEFESMVDDENELVSDHWEDIQNEAPQPVIAKAIPSLRYVAVSSGYMVKNDTAPGGSSFRGEAQWWRVVGDDKGSG
ncbi:uncharacterized protein C8Q71DRAFT_750146, partial [Rhodofomes roseus]